MNQKPYFEVVTVPLKDNKRVKHTENLDKIKLPFYCYYSLDGGKNLQLGCVDWNKGYFLQDHSEQGSPQGGMVATSLFLVDLITKYNINTVKVKIIVYE